MKAKFKLSQLAAIDTVTKELVHPKHGPTGIEVTLAGPSHPAWKEALKVFNATEPNDERGFKLFSSCVLGWDEEGMELPFTPENALIVFKDPKHEWAAKQMTDIVLDHSQFFQ